MCVTFRCQGIDLSVQLSLPLDELSSCLADELSSARELLHLLIEANDLLVHLGYLHLVDPCTFIEILHLPIDNAHALVECPPTSIVRINHGLVCSLSWLVSLHFLVEFRLNSLGLFG